MTRSELVDRLHTRFPALQHEDAKSVVTAILDALTSHLVADHRAEIRGFGSFQLSYRKPRMGRNPRSGENVQVPGKYVPHFKAGKELREQVDF